MESKAVEAIPALGEIERSQSSHLSGNGIKSKS